jgi:Fe-S cluster biogenesis protein NfuA
MNEELKAELESLSKSLEGKTAKEVKEAIEVFEKKSNEYIDSKVKELVGSEVKSVKEQMEKESSEALDAVKKGLNEKLETSQKHIDGLDIKLQSKKSNKSEKISFSELISNSIKDNFEAIKNVRKQNSAKIDVKVVGNMTLGNLTGDEPRVYSNTVVPVTSPIVNFVDLLGPAISIDGGTYTFPQETGSEGAVATQTEGSSKGQIDYDLTMQDVVTDFLAGYARYSKKMANNLPFLESFIPTALRRDYLKAENSKFNTALASGALASTELAASHGTYIEQLMTEIATLEALDNPVNGIVVTPADWWVIQATEKSTGAGFGLPGVVSYTNGVLYVSGIPVYKATWLAANKYYVGDWTRVKKVVAEGLSLEFSTEDSDNFTKNNITARIESQIGLAIERNTAIIYGDFTAV